MFITDLDSLVKINTSNRIYNLYYDFDTKFLIAAIGNYIIMDSTNSVDKYPVMFFDLIEENNKLYLIECFKYDNLLSINNIGKEKFKLQLMTTSPSPSPSLNIILSKIETSMELDLYITNVLTKYGREILLKLDNYKKFVINDFLTKLSVIDDNIIEIN